MTADNCSQQQLRYPELIVKKFVFEYPSCLQVFPEGWSIVSSQPGDHKILTKILWQITLHLPCPGLLYCCEHKWMGHGTLHECYAVKGSCCSKAVGHGEKQILFRSCIYRYVWRGFMLS